MTTHRSSAALRTILGLLAILLLGAWGISIAAAAGFGTWSGHVLLEWPDDDSGNKLRLRESVKFTDSSGTEWEAPKDAEIDTTLLSPMLQNLFGAPLTGKNRKAALLHHYQVRARENPWRETHRMYYEASRSLGVEELDAKLMYMAIYADAPRWAPRKSLCEQACHTKEVVEKTRMTWRPVVNQVALRPIVEWIEQQNPTLDQIDERVNGAITAAGPHLLGEMR